MCVCVCVCVCVRERERERARDVGGRRFVFCLHDPFHEPLFWLLKTPTDWHENTHTPDQLRLFVHFVHTEKPSRLRTQLDTSRICCLAHWWLDVLFCSSVLAPLNQTQRGRPGRALQELFGAPASARHRFALRAA